MVLCFKCITDITQANQSGLDANMVHYARVTWELSEYMIRGEHYDIVEEMKRAASLADDLVRNHTPRHCLLITWDSERVRSIAAG